MTATRADDRPALYEDAPCGLVHASLDGTIVAANRTLLGWLDCTADALIGRRFQSLLTVPSALLYETHCGPLLRLRGHVGELSLDILAASGARLPVLLNAVVRGDDGPGHDPPRLQIALLSAPTRREYERELQQSRRRAEETAELLRAQAELLAEHSAMLLPIRDGLRVMPVLGSIDAVRARQMLRALLHLDAAAGVRAVILDLTGMPELDAAGAEALRQAAVGLRLRGVQPIVTGIRPAVAHAITASGLRLDGLRVCGTLQDGVALADRLVRPRPLR